MATPENNLEAEVWYQWIDISSTDSTTSGNVLHPWNAWVQSTTTSLTYSTSAWVTWTTSDTASAWMTWTEGSYTTNVKARKQYVPPPLTAEQLAKIEADRKLAADRAAEAEKKRIQARDCARALLLSMLSVKQREQYEREKFFEVVSQRGNRYRIRNFTHGNVELLDANGKPVLRYCGQPNGVPTEDAILAQKLQLEHDEDTYVKKSNASRI